MSLLVCLHNFGLPCFTYSRFFSDDPSVQKNERKSLAVVTKINRSTALALAIFHVLVT